MTKSVRFLIVFVIFIAIIMVSRGNDLYRMIEEAPPPTLRAESTAVAVPTDEPTQRRNLILVEFFFRTLKGMR
jgi:hypothetical protein